MNEERIAFAIHWAMGCAATIGFAPLVLALRPAHHAAAASRLQARPTRSVFIGMLWLALMSAGFIGVQLVAAHRPRLAGMLGAILLIVLARWIAQGVGVAGRVVASRLLPDATPLRQTLVGTALIALAGLWPLAGILVVAIATAAGRGAWSGARDR